MSDYQTLQVEYRDSVALLTLNRPESLNAISIEMRRELLLAARQINKNEAIRAVVLTGAGRGFSSGADLSDVPLDDPHWRVDDDLNHDYKPALLEIYHSPKPWISAVHGPAAGIASAFAMVCDLTVMAEDAYIYQAFTAIGLIPDGGATWLLAHTIGRKRAYEIIATGEKLSAQKCLEWGLCNRVVASDELLDAALAWAADLAERAPLSLRYAKQAVRRAMEAGYDQTISDEAELQLICMQSEDAMEGGAAFLEKRKPVWKGR